MAIYLDPKNDLTFKRVFGKHKHLCISLIDSMLPLEKPIVNIEYQTGELIPILADVLRNTVDTFEKSKEMENEYYHYCKMWKIDAMTATAMIENAREKGEAIGMQRDLEKRDELKDQVVINASETGMSIVDMAKLTGLSTD